MLLVDEEIDRLESFLDGAQDAFDSDELRGRLARETELAAALGHLRGERALRQRVWAGMEPTDEAVERLMTRMKGATKRGGAWGVSWRIGSAVAACAAIGFFAGWKMKAIRTVEMARSDVSSVHPVGPKVETVVSYQVALKDEYGHVTAVQNFDSLEKAREFASDLGRWQERQHQMRDGAAVVVADRF